MAAHTHEAGPRYITIEGHSGATEGVTHVLAMHRQALRAAGPTHTAGAATHAVVVGSASSTTLGMHDLVAASRGLAM